MGGFSCAPRCPAFLTFRAHLSGPNFALGASYDSIQRSQAVAWCVVSFSSREANTAGISQTYRVAAPWPLRAEPLG